MQEVPVLKEEPVVEAKPEVKVEELPPPLPASPPPTEAPPPTPVATTPAPVSQIPDLADAHDNEVGRYMFTHKSLKSCCNKD